MNKSIIKFICIDKRNNNIFIGPRSSLFGIRTIINRYKQLTETYYKNRILNSGLIEAVKAEKIYRERVEMQDNFKIQEIEVIYKKINTHPLKGKRK